MAETFQFDPAPVDRAIAKLTKLHEQATHDNYRISQLQHLTRPGDAPDTQKFHKKLVTSMGHLKDQHAALISTIEAQIESLKQVKQRYAKTDQAAAAKLGGLQ